MGRLAIRMDYLVIRLHCKFDTLQIHDKCDSPCNHNDFHESHYRYDYGCYYYNYYYYNYYYYFGTG